MPFWLALFFPMRTVCVVSGRDQGGQLECLSEGRWVFLD